MARGASRDVTPARPVIPTGKHNAARETLMEWNNNWDVIHLKEPRPFHPRYFLYCTICVM